MQKGIELKQKPPINPTDETLDKILILLKYCQKNKEVSGVSFGKPLRKVWKDYSYSALNVASSRARLMGFIKRIDDLKKCQLARYILTDDGTEFLKRVSSEGRYLAWKHFRNKIKV